MDKHNNNFKHGNTDDALMQESGNEITSEFYELSDETKDLIDAIFQKMDLPINYSAIGSSKMKKKLVKLKKNSKEAVHLSGIDLIVSINEIGLANFDDTSKEILIAQEFDRIVYNFEKDTFTIKSFELNTNLGLIKKYNIDNIVKANLSVDLQNEQQKEKIKNHLNDE